MRRPWLVTLLVLLSTTRTADADPATPEAPAPIVEAEPAPTPMPSGHLRLLSGPGILTGPSGLRYLLPTDTHVVDDPTWERMDLEYKRLQDRETRLDAENKSLRKTAASWQPGWKVLATTLVTGLGLGWYVHSKF